MTIDDIERAAIQGNEMPGELNTAEQLFYQKLRYLYAMFRTGKLDRRQGHLEKLRIIEQYKADLLAYRILESHRRIYNATSQLLSEANKSDCERCKKIAQLLDGRSPC